MNNNIQRINKKLAEICKECVSIANEDLSAKKEILRGGGSNGGIMTRLLNPRPINSIRISQDALKLCLENDVLPFDYFILTSHELRKKYGNFFSSNEKNIELAHKKGHYLTGDHNIPNKVMIEKMFKLYEENPKVDVKVFRKILEEQSYDLITLEENEILNQNNLKFSGSKEERDKFCSPKIEFKDLWLTPQSVIDKFFEISKINRAECLDPCASDGRWLGLEGKSIDILPMKKHVEQKDFLTLTKNEIDSKIKYIVGNLPFSLLDEFVNKALELRDECFFLVNGDTIFKHFPENIKHIYIFSGLEGNQKDNRSRSEFDVPFLIKSALWCCIVHITKEKQKPWVIEHNISNEEKRDGKHIALGKNTFINCEQNVDNDKRITRIPVKSEIKWKGGKSIIIDGKEVSISNYEEYKNN